jgi:hypothetical protein
VQQEVMHPSFFFPLYLYLSLSLRPFLLTKDKDKVPRYFEWISHRASAKRRQRLTFSASAGPATVVVSPRGATAFSRG